RLRAVARDLEERAILDPMPGRTAAELAADAGRELPGLADELAAGARLFEDVTYGEMPGSAEGYARLVRLDEQVAAARPRPLTAGGGERGGRRRPPRPSRPPRATGGAAAGACCSSPCSCCWSRRRPRCSSGTTRYRSGV